MNELIDFLIDRDVEYKRNTKLACYSTIGIGGIADVIIFPDTKKKLIGILRKLADIGKAFCVLGNMSNVLFTDCRTETVFISTRRLSRISVVGNKVSAECGVMFSRLIMTSAQESLSGYESLFSIPGTVGAMLCVNAGAYGATASDCLESTEVFDIRTQKTETLAKKDIDFYYRGSSLKEDGYIVLDALFSLNDLPKESIIKNIDNIRIKRIETQPISEKSLGSVFKRGENYSAAYLIDKAGLKGVRIGGISVSSKHAGFFVNDGTGTAEQFKELAELVKREVRAKFNVDLETEVEYVY